MKSKENITVRKLVELLNKEENMTGGASGKERILGLYINGNRFGYVTSAKLDGWGDGLVTDVYLELETEVSTNADRIRTMKNAELAEFLHNIYSYLENGEPVLTLCLGDKCDIEINDNYGYIKEWLESEVDNG